MARIDDCEVRLNQEVAEDHYRMVVRAPEIAKEARAGQFCMIEVQEGLYPFLRRPMSFERIYPDGVSILYKVEGKGTRMMARFSPGQAISIQGPLGNPFPLNRNYDRHVLVAGGIGVAPFPALAEAIIGELGSTPEVILAARSERHLLCESEFHEMGCKVHLATDDGSAGERAFASEVLHRLGPGDGSMVYCCGPMPMMHATHDVCVGLGVPCLASLEAEMACGDGVCLGCVVPTVTDREAGSTVRVCHDGPVFDTSLIDWDGIAGRA